MSLNLTCAVTEFGNVLGNITVLYKMSSASYGFASYLDAERLADWFLLGGNDASLWRSRVKAESEFGESVLVVSRPRICPVTFRSSQGKNATPDSAYARDHCLQRIEDLTAVSRRFREQNKSVIQIK